MAPSATEPADGLTLRRPRPDDVEAVGRLAGGVRGSAHIPGGPASPERAASMLRCWLDDWGQRGVGYWMLEQRSSGLIVGWAGVRWLPEAPAPVLNLAYRLAPELWGGGRATWAAEQALSLAAEVRATAPTIARIAAGNVGSERVAMRCGLARVGVDAAAMTVFADRPLPAELLRALPPV